ncbi:MAG: nucleotidyltransferase family protein [Flavobacteriaceae bacterium]|nr:nucleotidyltransferase family protein [Flavobacteriaceae bacterium]
MTQNKCVAVILAGGKSSRMGQPKGLLDFFGRFWLQEQLKRLKAGGITEICIGLGYDFEAYFKALPFLEQAQNDPITWLGLTIKVTVNQTPKFGSFSTLKKALKLISKENNILLVPIDVPVLNKTDLNNLLKQEGAVVKPIFRGKTGHPIILKSEMASQLLHLPEQSRLDFFINNLAASQLKKIPCSDSQINININTPKNWEMYKRTCINGG